jgi:integrase
MLAIGHVLAYAVREWHWLPVNPMDAVSKPRVHNARARYLDDTIGPDGTSELTRLLDACRVSESPDLRPYVLLSLVTGGRSSEVLGLTWGDVDLTGDTVTFRDTKNGDTRRVSISPEVEDLLRERPGRGIAKALVFPSPVDPTKPVSIRSSWETALRRAGTENFRPHDWRHSAASDLAMEGATLAELAGVLGHRTLAMVKRYSHLSPEHVATASTRIGARIAAKTGGV